jgi:DNA (cytosine-5)-methyltransferase 1
VLQVTAYYNEFDKDKAAWLRELIKAGVIAPGDVDERSIKDVRESELVGYTQCHWFAGIGVWSYALRLAGWPDDREVWTGSCPCPGFSCAGKGGGFDDPRHLWPDWYPLISECRPPVIFGEQADDAIGFGWLDLVCGNLEASGYAVAPAVLGAHSAGAPHIRQRLYFCADTSGSGHDGRRTGKEGASQSQGKRSSSVGEPERLRNAGQRADTDGRQPCDGNLQRSGEQRLLAEDSGTMRGSISLHAERRPVDEHGEDGFHRQDSRREETHGIAGTCSEVLSGGTTPQRGQSVCGSAPGKSGYASCSSELGVEIDAKFEGLEGLFGNVRDWRGPGWLDPLTARSVAEAGATRGYWADCDWWYGRDEKYRPIGPGLFPLASRATARVLRLRGYGDAIVAPVAQAFIEAYMSIDNSTNEREIEA